MKFPKIKPTEILALIAGAVVASKVANIQAVPEKLRAPLPLILGIVLMGNKSPLLKNAGLAMVAVGGTKTLGAFVPQLGISAEMISEDYQIIEGSDYALAGATAETMSGSSYALAGTSDAMNSDTYFA